MRIEVRSDSPTLNALTTQTTRKKAWSREISFHELVDDRRHRGVPLRAGQGRQRPVERPRRLKRLQLVRDLVLAHVPDGDAEDRHPRAALYRLQEGGELVPLDEFGGHQSRPFEDRRDAGPGQGRPDLLEPAYPRLDLGVGEGAQLQPAALGQVDRLDLPLKEPAEIRVLVVGPAVADEDQVAVVLRHRPVTPRHFDSPLNATATTGRPTRRLERPTP